MAGAGSPRTGKWRLPLSRAGRQAAGWSKVSVSNASDSMDPVYPPLPPPSYGVGGPKGRRGKAPTRSSRISDHDHCLSDIVFGAFPLRPFGPPPPDDGGGRIGGAMSASPKVQMRAVADD